jgi:hypothetical protein
VNTGVPKSGNEIRPTLNYISLIRKKITLLKGFLTPEECTGRLSRNVIKKLPLLAA